MADLFSNLGLGRCRFPARAVDASLLGGASIPIPVNILLCLIGALVGTLVGVLPGIGTDRHDRHAAADHALACRRSAR